MTEELIGKSNAVFECAIVFYRRQSSKRLKENSNRTFYKGKGDKMECKNCRGISLLSIPGQVYGRVLVERVREMTEGLTEKEQCGF